MWVTKLVNRKYLHSGRAHRAWFQHVNGDQVVQLKIKLYTNEHLWQKDVYKVSHTNLKDSQPDLYRVQLILQGRNQHRSFPRNRVELPHEPLRQPQKPRRPLSVWLQFPMWKIDIKYVSLGQEYWLKHFILLRTTYHLFFSELRDEHQNMVEHLTLMKIW